MNLKLTIEKISGNPEYPDVEYRILLNETTLKKGHCTVSLNFIKELEGGEYESKNIESLVHSYLYNLLNINFIKKYLEQEDLLVEIKTDLDRIIIEEGLREVMGTHRKPMKRVTGQQNSGADEGKKAV